MEISCKIKVSASVIQNSQNNDLLNPLEIESGAFHDIPHYSGMSTSELYFLHLNGFTSMEYGEVPARDVLKIVDEFIRSNIYILIQMYAENIETGVETTGHIIGSFINSYHVKAINDFDDPGNGLKTIKKKGFDNPLIDKGQLVNNIFYSINGEGRYK